MNQAGIFYERRDLEKGYPPCRDSEEARGRRLDEVRSEISNRLGRNRWTMQKK